MFGNEIVRRAMSTALGGYMMMAWGVFATAQPARLGHLLSPLYVQSSHVAIDKYVPRQDTLFYDIYVGNLAAVRNRVKADPALIDRPENTTYFTPLHFAALYDKPEIAEFLIMHGAKVNAMHLNYATPLHLAARSGSLAVAKILVAHGAKLNVKDKDYGCSPLLAAALAQKTEVAEYLADKGADLNIKTNDQFDALYAASFTDNKPLVTFLLAKGMNIETTNNMNLTPLGVAVLNNLPSIVKLLLDKGAKNHVSNFGSLYDIATQGGRTDTSEIIALLKDHGMAPTVIEGESLLLTTIAANGVPVPGAIASNGDVVKQPMSNFSGSWSQNAQLFWRAGSIDDTLTLHLEVKEAGQYKLIGSFTKANDYGIVTFSIGGQSLPTVFDGYNTDVINSGPVSLGTASFPARSVDLIVRMTGKNTLSRGYCFGLDTLTVDR